MNNSLLNKPEFKRLKRKLNVPQYAVIGVLESIHNIGKTRCQDGAIGKLNNEEIADELEWVGNPDNLVDALVEYGWLDICTENRLLIHDWAKRCPNFIKGAMAKHGKKFAIRQPAQGNLPKAACPEQHAQGSVPKAKLPKATCPEQPALSSMPKATCLEQTAASRARICNTNTNTNTNTSLSSSFGLDTNLELDFTSSAASLIPAEPVTPFLTFPTNGNPGSWVLSLAQVVEWEGLYIGVDVRAECRKALGWVNAQTAKKTARGMPRFLANWLSRATDRPKNNSHARPNSLDDLAEKRGTIGVVGKIPENDPILAHMRRVLKPNPLASLALPPNFASNGRSTHQLSKHPISDNRSPETKFDGITEESKNG